MKRIFIFCLTVLGLCLGAGAKPVDQETAKAVAVKFMKTSDVRLSTVYRTDKSLPAFYVFNTIDGFVIVAADDCETPIIGYSHESQFDLENVPVQMEDYLQDFVERIQYGIENQVVADEVTARQWELVKTTGRLNDKKNVKVVEPLITARWHQGCFYNNLCPEMENTACNHARVGCVAVAMGQIMHYWGYPIIGQGSYSYHDGFSGNDLSVDFGDTRYDWANMPVSLSENSSDAEIEAVATLLYHCGVSVGMGYGVNSSSANSTDVPNALVSYFRYLSDLHVENKGNDNDEWLSKLKNCLDLQRPVYYSGRGNGGGHAFVCDGYDSNDLLHFNWGWGGGSNGYFALGNLNPGGSDYNSSNSAIFDIVPDLTSYEVSPTVMPPSGGHIDGTGNYLLYEECTLRAVPEGAYSFCYWRQNGNVVSYDPVYPITILGAVNGLEACFTLRPIAEFEVDSSGFDKPMINLSFVEEDSLTWSFLKQFEIDKGVGAITDGEFVYVFIHWNSLGYQFATYTMDGEFVENFSVEGCNYLSCIAYDGSCFYGCDRNYALLYAIDLKNKQLLETVELPFLANAIAYDAVRDAFWVAGAVGSSSQTLYLLDRSGHVVETGPRLPFTATSAGIIEGTDRYRHLLIRPSAAKVYDYNIDNDMLDPYNMPILDVESGPWIMTVGKYEGKDAVWACNQFDHVIKIYEPRNVFSKVMYYRLYRADAQGNAVMIADHFTETSFLDVTAGSGSYRYGFSAVYYDGSESNIVWSDAMNYGIDEHQTLQINNVQKIIENGQLYILVNGKKYSVTGQVCR